MKAVPKLRFKEFKDTWKRSTLGAVAEVKRGAASQHLKYMEQGENCIRLLRINDFLKDDAVYIEDTEDIKRFRVRANDLLIAGTGATAGITFIVPEKFDNLAYSYNAPRIRVSDADYLFVYSYLKSEIILSQQKRLFVGNAQPFLDTDAIRGFKINFPTLPEQQKISSFLTAVDEKIQQLTRKKELLEQYKKGVMQQLFSGKLRFKEKNGKPYPKWEEKRLGEVIKLQGGYAFKSNLFQTDGIPVIRISNISNDHNYIDLNNIVYYQEIERPENFTIKSGDLLIAMSGATTGKSSIYNLPYKAYLNQRVGLFKSINKNLNYGYLIQFVFSDEFRKQLDAVLVAGAQPNVSGSDIEGFKFIMPSLEEQQKIASFLSAIDAKVEGVANQITKAQTFKKGLLQQMFV